MASWLAGLLAVLLAGAAAAGPLDLLYDDDDLGDLAARYERGWKDNFDNVFLPILTPDEASRLAHVDFRMERRVEEAEPFGFMAGGDTVIASAASLLFLEDIAMAYTWLDRKGFSTRSVADYLLMLRYWPTEAGRPPKPGDALCMPADAFDDPEVADRARRAFDTAAVFILLHEYGHVHHRHPGNRAVPPAVSRVNESDADSFAFDLIARAGDMPIGVPILFFTMAHLHENRADYGSDADYRTTLAARTHPISPERVQSLARHMSAWASTYETNSRPEAQLSALSLALEISQFGHLLADPGAQRLAASIGQTARPEDLAPRPAGRFLAEPCGRAIQSGAFSGRLAGEITDGSTPLDVDVVLERSGDRVTGAYSFGAGFGRMEGEVAGNTLAYSWTLGSDHGQGQLILDGSTYRGSWDRSGAETGGGEIVLTSP
ncbi:MAG TPA: M48 family metalloprotease [Thermohalobaculum sp.]|nr:M48 family metalloprotease [Thermohalobaculum sp.]